MVIALRVGRQPVHAGTSPLAELMASLHVLAEPDHHPEARGWLQRTHASLPDRLRSDLHRFAPLWARYRSRLFFPMDERLDRSLAEELNSLAALPDDQFLPFAANAIRGHITDLEGAAAVVEDGGWVRECEKRSFARGDLAHTLVHNPAAFRRHLLELLDRCAHAFFTSDWERAGPLLDASASTIARKLRVEPVLDVITGLADVASTRGSTDAVYIDKLQQIECSVDEFGLLLIPSIRAHPHLIVKPDPGVPKILHYSTRTTGETQRPSQHDMQKRLLVLSEPLRWELCRHLINEAITTTELATRTRSSKSAVSRHLRALRAVRLVESTREGRQVFHRLDTAVILRLGSESLEAIIR